jgi:hypothetical protein
MSYSPSEPTLQRAKELLDAARDSPMGQRLSESGFDIDMSDAEQANALAMHVLHQLQVLDATTRMLASTVQALQSRIEGSETLFL